jgi:hypothetical protein
MNKLFRFFSWLFDIIDRDKYRIIRKIARYDHNYGRCEHIDGYIFPLGLMTMTNCDVIVLDCGYRELTFRLPGTRRHLYWRDVVGEEKVYGSGIWFA